MQSTQTAKQLKEEKHAQDSLLASVIREEVKALQARCPHPFISSLIYPNPEEGSILHNKNHIVRCSYCDKELSELE